MESLYFKGHVPFYYWLIDNGIDIDVMASLKGYRFSLVIGGKNKFNRSLVGMLSEINKISNLNIDENKSMIKGKNGYLIVFKGNEESESSEEIVEEVVESVEAIEVSEDSVTLDEDKINSFLEESSSKKEAKSKLEDYAKEVFNVELDKRASFENMLEILKESI
jgi:hypothetical protein|tara:strand:+ start:6178 stop:6669 length:492 start_codon:yes stop_codon:yes gene_type:complete